MNRNLIVGITVYLRFDFGSIIVFPNALPFLPAAIAIGLLIRVAYRYPQGTCCLRPYLNEMRNPYASPVARKTRDHFGNRDRTGVPGTYSART